MNLLYRADQEQSLNVMLHAYLAATPCIIAKKLPKNAATVGHAFLNARYYDSQRGQFLSEDPVFWGEPQKQDLQNPQNLNSYSYAADNPIIKSDPSGKCVEDLCAGEVTALALAARYGPMVIGAVGSGAGTIILNHLQNQSTSVAEFTISTAVGGFTGEYLAARRVLAGGAAFFGSLAQDYAAKRPLDYGNAGTGAATAFLTGEFFKFGVGASSLEKAAAKGVTNLSDAGMVNELRYQLSLGAFQMSAAGVVQNAYFNSQKAMSSSLQYAKSTPSTLPSTVKKNGINYVRNSSGLLNVSTH